MRALNKLSAVGINRLKNPGLYGDGGGLWLRVTPAGTKHWVFRFMLDGTAKAMGLGPLHTVNLAEARERARRARLLLLDKIDPLAERQAKQAAERAAEAKRVTFREAADAYMAGHRAGWKNAKHAEQWSSTLESYAYPVVGDLHVAAIDTALVLKILEPIWAVKTETASRVRGRIEAVLDWARARHLREGENPARWRGHLDKLLPAKTRIRKVRHQPAMPFVDVPAFMAELRGNETISARALEFTILTAARTGETIGARWSEIDFAAKLWIAPGERTKSGREHRVPLCDRALAILSAVPREGDGAGYVFPGARRNRPLSNMAMLELLRGLRKDSGFTVHGFRSSFRDWAAERTNYPREIAEAALAHVVGDKVEAAYRRGDALEKRRRLMAAWAGYCGNPKAAGEVVALRAGT